MTRKERMRANRLAKLGDVGPMVAASLCRRDTTCGNPNCKCARGEKHKGWCLTYKGPRNKTKTVHVPKDMVEEVREWVAEHKRVKKLLSEISQLSMEIMREHNPRKRAAMRAAKENGKKSRP